MDVVLTPTGLLSMSAYLTAQPRPTDLRCAGQWNGQECEALAWPTNLNSTTRRACFAAHHISQCDQGSERANQADDDSNATRPRVKIRLGSAPATAATAAPASRPPGAASPVQSPASTEPRDRTPGLKAALQVLLGQTRSSLTRSPTASSWPAITSFTWTQPATLRRRRRVRSGARSVGNGAGMTPGRLACPSASMPQHMQTTVPSTSAHDTRPQSSDPSHRMTCRGAR